VKHKRKKGRKGKKPRKPAEPQKQLKSKSKLTFRTVFYYPFVWVQENKIFASSCVLIGLIASVTTFLTLAPRLQITPSGLLEGSNATSTQFEIKNEGFTAADIVDVQSKFGNVTANSEHFKDGQMNGNIVQLGSIYLQKIKMLRAGEKGTLPLNGMLNISDGHVTANAELTWIVAYKIHIFRFIGTFYYSQAFKSSSDHAGNIVWSAVSEK
jgi:hypothetical protein